ncbi:MAG: hypothetical protein AAF518_07110 [Spirochaetota bacterium]
MKYLKGALIFFAIVDFAMFLVYQSNPDLLAPFLPQFNLQSTDHIYQRLVGNLFLMLGLARLYGALYLHEKGAIIVSMWSWVVELVYTSTELAHGQFMLVENIMALVLAPAMLFWSFTFYKKMQFAENK